VETKESLSLMNKERCKRCDHYAPNVRVLLRDDEGDVVNVGGYVGDCRLQSLNNANTRSCSDFHGIEETLEEVDNT